MAEEIVREEFKRNYAAYVIHKDKKASGPSTKVRPVFFFFLNATYSHGVLPCQRKVDSDDSDSSGPGEKSGDSDSSMEEEELMTELDHYLKSARLKAVKDPLQWWFDNRGTYPRLSRMAKDFLTIPGESFYSAGFKYLKT